MKEATEKYNEKLTGNVIYEGKKSQLLLTLQICMR